LPDKFYLEGVHSINLRDRLFREIVSNLLIHREFANGFPAKLIIEKDRVHTENWSRPHGLGLIDPLKFVPFPRNPIIAKFFKEIGRVDELDPA
jgi:ATP-dependent DNA helicase RecG